LGETVSQIDPRLSTPCNCTDKNTTGLIISDTERLGQKALRDSHCIPLKIGFHLVRQPKACLSEQ
jgi:hypothetical protein